MIGFGPNFSSLLLMALLSYSHRQVPIMGVARRLATNRERGPPAQTGGRHARMERYETSHQVQELTFASGVEVVQESLAREAASLSVIRKLTESVPPGWE